MGVLVSGGVRGHVPGRDPGPFAWIIPAEKSGEFFGIFDICGKGASFIGTALVGVITQATGNPGMGVGMLAVLFAIGFGVFGAAAKESPKRKGAGE